ncbi:MAG: secretin and TonB N-terminal domain-containing protein [Betaproteobacteria bacterium]|nr:secretin and TonB N-terminal domain-containing protein [Betaproteobacteria bacterium]MBV9362188.1 secretin and TonB N-terminal domain-containing protein [Betaproteobacteria bacterium]
MKKLLAFLILALVVAACATDEEFKKARIEVQAGNEEQGLARLEQEIKAHPDDVELRNYYQRHKEVAVQRYLALGDNARAAGALDRAQASYERALRFDPQNRNAQVGLQLVRRDRESATMLVDAMQAMKAGNTADAQIKLKQIVSENPQNKEAKGLLRQIEEKQMKDNMTPKLTAALKRPITMEFRDAPLRTVLELISRQTGLNFVFDKEVQPDTRTTVFVRDTPIEEVIRYVLVTNQLDKKILNENTILIYPNTPAKSRDYKDLVVRSFYLSNADAKQTAQMVRQLVKTRDLFVDEKLNLLVMRDTPEAIAVAEKLISNQDKSEPEVMLEVQIMEIGDNDLTQAGIQWPGQVGIGLQGAAGVPGSVTGTEATHFNSGLVRVTVPDPMLIFRLTQQVGRNNILANPRIRTKSREKARIHIGDKVPVITTTAGATGFVSESVNYLDVGLKLEVEPQVFLDDDVGIKIGLEVSNIGSQIKTSSGTIAYQVGTRNTSTVLRLHDGETQILAGLISNEDRRNSTQVPGLANLPVAGRLFQSKDDTANKTEIVMLITPRVVRNIERPAVNLEQFNSGTEAEVGGASLALPSVIPSAVPAPSAPVSPMTPAAPQPAIPSTLGSPAPAAGPQTR